MVVRKQTRKSGKLYQPIPSLLLLERTNFVRLLGYWSCYKQRCTMLLEKIKGFYRGITKIFLLVGSYTMLS